MNIIRIYTEDGQPNGFFLEHEEALAAQYVADNGGYYREERV